MVNKSQSKRLLIILAIRTLEKRPRMSPVFNLLEIHRWIFDCHDIFLGNTDKFFHHMKRHIRAAMNQHARSEGKIEKGVPEGKLKSAPVDYIRISIPDFRHPQSCVVYIATPH